LTEQSTGKLFTSEHGEHGLAVFFSCAVELSKLVFEYLAPALQILLVE
jgi:hypothetical protein